MKMYSILTVFLCIIIRLTSGQIANTTNGQVIGRNVNNVAIFYAIPFAAPPLGNLRFMKPQDAPKWQGILPCNVTYSKKCMQATTVGDDVSEDCLYLNVFTPNMYANPPLPVMVFIHGGAYAFGSAADFSDQGIARNLAARGVVVVTLNYRLNGLGFFTTRTADFPANVGMFDQAKALEWVQKNVENFGGNASRVTLFGESAGATSVSFHTYSPISKGYFQQVIMESGSAYAPTSSIGIRTTYDPSMDFAVKLNCITADQWIAGSNFTAMKDCLQKKNISEIMNVILNMPKQDPGQQRDNWVVQIDGPGGFLPARPETLAGTRDPNMKVMIGTMRDESAQAMLPCLALSQCFVSNFTRETVLAGWLAPITQAPIYDLTRNELNNILNFIYYGGLDYIAENDSMAWLNNSVQMSTDYLVNYPTRKELDAWISINARPYMFSFDYVTQQYPWSFAYPSVPHAVELFFLFDEKEWAPGVPWNRTPDDQYAVDLFGIMWTNFAKTGNPNLPTPSNPPSPQWLPSSAQAQYYSMDARKSGMRPEFRHLAYNLWGRLVNQIQAAATTTTSTTTTPKPTTVKNVAPKSLGSSSLVRIGLLLAVLCKILY